MRKLAIITDENNSMHCYAENDHVFIVGETTRHAQMGEDDDEDEKMYICQQYGTDYQQALFPSDLKIVDSSNDLRGLVGKVGEVREDVAYTTFAGRTVRVVDIHPFRGMYKTPVLHVVEAYDDGNPVKLSQHIKWVDFEMNY